MKKLELSLLKVKKMKVMSTRSCTSSHQFSGGFELVCFVLLCLFVFNVLCWK